MAERYIDSAMLKGSVKTGRSHLLNTEFSALEKSGLKEGHRGMVISASSQDVPPASPRGGLSARWPVAVANKL